MTRIFDYLIKDWNKASEEALEILKEVARNTGLITYKQLAERIGFTNDDLQYAIPYLIGQLSCDEDDKDKGLISGLVINNETKIPGDGFFKLAKELGRKFGNKDVFWFAEVNRIYEENKPKVYKIKKKLIIEKK